MKVETFGGLLLLQFWMICGDRVGFAPDIDVNLPLGQFLGLEAVTFGDSLPNGTSKQQPGIQINLPFSDFGLPVVDSLLSSVSERPAVGFSSAGLKGQQPPLSVVNLPFSQFNLPLSNVKQTGHELPSWALLQLENARLSERKENISPLDSRSGASVRSSAAVAGRSSNVNSGGGVKIAEGNLDNLLITKGPRGMIPGLPNQMSLPLSILNAPLNSLQLPLSHMLLPFSHVNSLPQSLSTVSVKAGSEKKIKAGISSASKKGSGGSTPELGKEPAPAGSHSSDLIAQATEALGSPLGFSLETFSMPYSFLNTPLGFFNLPLSFVNLPYASTNLPFGHLNLPLSFFNLPLFELAQTFGSVPVPAARNLPSSPLDNSEYFKSDFKRKDAEVPSLTPEEIKSWNRFAEFFSSFSGERERTVSEELFSQPSDAMDLANELLESIIREERMKITPDNVGKENNLLKNLGSILRSNGVPSIPSMGGLFGTANSLFTTPFSLFNLPLGFNDMPVGFMNLPFSHFNLPLSHLSLPFANLALPVNDIATPEVFQTVHNASIELADIPPSLLEITNPENSLNSYLNLPLAEMNLPLAVMDMPFTVFDMPFAFLNTPLAHFNNPLTHLHLPFEISSLPLAELALPFEQFINYGF